MAEGEVAQGQGRGIPPTLIGAVVLAAAVLAFVFQNTDKVKVNWLFFDVTAPLWVVLLVTSVAAIAAGELAGMAIRRARKK